MGRISTLLESIDVGKMNSGRDLEKALYAEFERKLKGSAMAQLALREDNPRLLLTEAAKTQVGVREQGGNNNGPMVRLYQMTIGGAGREAWCMAFVQSCIAYVENKMNVHSPIFPAEHCLTVWGETSKLQRVKYHPLGGAIAIWQHGTSTNGHTGIVLDCDNKMFHAVEGNTTAGLAHGRVIRDGGGVYYTSRNISGTGSMNVVGFLKPF